REPARLGLAIATAVTSWITFQSLVNMATVTDTLPITGVPLPLISYGGSSVAMTLAAIGVLLNIASPGRLRPVAGLAESDSESESIHEAADIGRRNWWAFDARPRRRPRLRR